MADQILAVALQAMDTAGASEPGAKLYVYQTGTTTPVTVYTASDLTTAHPTPIVADGSGYFPQAFYGGSSALKIVIADSEDVVLQTVDPAILVGSSGGGASDVSFSPSSDITSSNVQDAIEEVQGNIGGNGGATNGNTLVTTSGVSSAYVISSPSTISAYSAGQKYLLRANHASTGAATLNVDGLGAKALQRYDAAGSLTDIAAGEIAENTIFQATYDGTRFILLRPLDSEIVSAVDTSLATTDWRTGAYGGPLFVLEDQKSSGTDGGDSAEAWTARDLNIEVYDPDSVVTLSSNQFTSTVAAWVEFAAPANSSASHQSRLYNVTDGVEVAAGQSVRTTQSGNSVGGGLIAAGKTYRIETRVSAAQLGNGFGDAQGWTTEVYTRVTGWRA